MMISLRAKSYSREAVKKGGPEVRSRWRIGGGRFGKSEPRAPETGVAVTIGRVSPGRLGPPISIDDARLKKFALLRQLAQDAARVAGGQHTFREVAGDHAARADDAPRADRHPRTDDRPA